jgi:hypothetical protein
MQPNCEDDQWWFEGPDDFQRTRDLLARSNATDAGSQEALGVKDFPTPCASDIPPLLRRTKRGTTQDTLIRLCLLGVPTGLEATCNALPPMGLQRWITVGFLACQHGQVVTSIKLLPFKGLMLGFDDLRGLATGSRTDFVMDIGSSTLALTNLALCQGSRLTLDLGTGCGAQCLGLRCGSQPASLQCRSIQ